MINLTLVEQNRDIRIGLGGLDQKLHITFDTSMDSKVYTGQTVVIPDTEKDQTLKTKGYRMASNIEVKKISFYETTNTSKGLTAYIGG